MNNNQNLIKKDNNILPLAKYNSLNFSEASCVAFIGSPLKHPYDEEKFILIANPLSDHTQFFEFSKVDVVSIEDMTSLLSKKGESIHMSKIWIKSGVLALRYEPFIVSKTNEFIDQLRSNG